MGKKSFDEQFFPQYLVQIICSLKYYTLKCKGGSYTFLVICLLLLLLLSHFSLVRLCVTP